MNHKIEPIVDNNGKSLPLSAITYTSKGNIIIKRPTTSVLKKVI